MDIKSYDSLVCSNISGVEIQEDVHLSDLRPLESRIHRATSKAMPRSNHCRIFPFRRLRLALRCEIRIRVSLLGFAIYQVQVKYGGYDADMSAEMPPPPII